VGTNRTLLSSHAERRELLQEEVAHRLDILDVALGESDTDSSAS
jgi:hypothetical protein